MPVYTQSGITYNDSTTQTSKADISLDTGRLIATNVYNATTTTTSQYTWTKPSGCNKVFVQVVGGGGGGASYNESGGGGAYAEKLIDVTAVSTVTVTVGGGGTSVVYYAAGGNGSTSSFGSYVTCTGGYGCNRQADHTGGVGGTATGGDLNVRGGSGTGHGNTSGREAVGRGGSSFFGQGNGASHSTNTANLGTSAPGAGGVGGAMQAWVGSNGAPGMVIVYSFS